MNTPIIHWQQYNRPLDFGHRRPALGLYPFIFQVVRFLASVSIAIAVVTVAAWVVNEPAMLLYLQVTIWTAGLVFFGAAIEAEKPATSWLAVATGITLPILAHLSKNQAPELLILAAFLVAGWLSVAVFQASRTARR